MEGEIKAAVERAERRKEAANVSGTEISSEETSRQIFSGLDLDYDEILTFHQSSVEAAKAASEEGVPIAHLIGGCAVDGLMIGILLEKARHGE